MALFTEESVRANIRNRDGKRVFYLAEGDRLTPSAKEWLRNERVEIFPAAKASPEQYRLISGGIVSEKPEHMTHLQADLLVRKDDPRIAFRGWIDLLQAEVLLVGHMAAQRNETMIFHALNEILQLLRQIIQCDVLGTKLDVKSLCGLSLDEIRQHSHVPQKYYGQPHFMPAFDDSELLLYVNRIRTVARQAELAACSAFQDRDGNPTRKDILETMNRISSMLWILEIRMKKGAETDALHR